MIPNKRIARLITVANTGLRIEISLSFILKTPVSVNYSGSKKHYL
jgi:hypothetical protein